LSAEVQILWAAIPQEDGMFYKVISGGKAWYSKEIIKSFYHCGDDLQRKIIDGTLTAFMIMDRIVYAPSSKKDIEYIEKMYSPVPQNVDTIIKDFIKPKKDKPDLSVVERVGYDEKEPVYEYGGFKFIKFSAVISKTKYRDQQHLPVLEICGTKYVALGCIKRGEVYYIG
jgi:hypothetical protein